MFFNSLRVIAGKKRIVARMRATEKYYSLHVFLFDIPVFNFPSVNYSGTEGVYVRPIQTKAPVEFSLLEVLTFFHLEGPYFHTFFYYCLSMHRYFFLRKKVSLEDLIILNCT